MPIKYHWEAHGFHLNAWGHISDSDIYERNRAFSNDQRCDDCYYQVFDGRQIQGFESLERSMTAMASNDIGMSSYIRKLAIILIAEDDTVLSAFRHYIDTCRRSGTTWTFHICRTLQEACERLIQLEQQRPTRLIRPFPKINPAEICSDSNTRR